VNKKLFICLMVSLALLSIVGVLSGCTSMPSTAPQTTAAATAPAAPAVTTPAKPANPELIMASTTSTGDSGLMSVLIPVFEQKTGYKVKPIYVGSGAAMTMGEKGEADVLLVHAPDSEVKFMQAGHGATRKLVMHNDFIIVGPASDPAGIKGMTSALDAMKKIAANKSIFVTRGDNSGTHQLELKLWKTAAVTTAEQTWYQSTGQGMGATLTIVSEKSAYTIADRATFLATQKNLSLNVLVQGDPALLNIYHVIQVDPAKSNKINAGGAKAFSDFMVSPATQELIKTFGADKYGQPLFFPDAGKTEKDLGSV
jgi:tungstate transport system substrate-binding protein